MPLPPIPLDGLWWDAGLVTVGLTLPAISKTCREVPQLLLLGKQSPLRN